MTNGRSALQKRAPGDAEWAIGQAIDSLTEAAERGDDPEQQALYQQVMNALRQMQSDEL